MKNQATLTVFIRFLMILDGNLFYFGPPVWWSTVRDASNCDYVSLLEPVWNSARGCFLLLLREHGTGWQQNSSWCVPRQFPSVS